jgi:hypothetical protein
LNFTFIDHIDVNTTPNGPLQNFAGTDGWHWLSPIAGGGPMPHLHGSLSAVWDTNLFNEIPPYDAGEGGIDTQLYSPMGRFLNLRAAYKF